jgi:MinD superfamily P-loop ATPase
LILSIASGKGGTGKTLVATSLALSLEEKVQVLDCDVEEPNDHVLLKPVITHRESVCIPVPNVDQEKCINCGICSDVCAYNAIAALPKMVLVFPELCHGCGACSYLCPEEAISEVDREVGIIETGHTNGMQFVHGMLNVGEAMPVPVIRQVKARIDPDSTVLIDVSPGTSCPVVESIKDSNFCLLVTEPTPFGLNDLVLAVEVARKLDIPCGVVLNRANVGDGEVQQYCNNEGIPVLLTIPLDMNIAGYYSRGIPLVEGIPEWRERFIELFDRIKELAGSHVGT